MNDSLLNILLDVFGMWDFVWERPDPCPGRPECIDAQATSASR